MGALGEGAFRIDGHSGRKQAGQIGFCCHHRSFEANSRYIS